MYQHLIDIVRRLGCHQRTNNLTFTSHVIKYVSRDQTLNRHFESASAGGVSEQSSYCNFFKVSVTIYQPIRQDVTCTGRCTETSPLSHRKMARFRRLRFQPARGEGEVWTVHRQSGRGISGRARWSETKRPNSRG